MNFKVRLGLKLVTGISNYDEAYTSKGFHRKAGLTQVILISQYGSLRISYKDFRAMLDSQN